MARAAVLLSLLACSAPRLACSSGEWHQVNVQEVNCLSGNRSTQFTMDLPNDTSPDAHYVFTVFRTSLQASELGFTATDATGKIITKVEVPLARLAARRLRVVSEDGVLSSEAGSSQGVRRLEELDGLFDEDDGELGDEVLDRPPASLSSPRNLAGRRSGFSSPRRRSYSPSPSYSSPRRRSYVAPSPSPSYSSPRRRSSVAPSPSVAPSRRRSTPTPSPDSAGSWSTHRRRASTPAVSGYRRRYAPAGASSTPSYSYSNPSSPGAGRYGYKNEHSLVNNYGGHQPMQTKYGYSGANAYRGGSGKQLAMAVGGGMLAGAAGAYVLSHLVRPNFPHHLMPPGDLSWLNCKCGHLAIGTCSSCSVACPSHKCYADVKPAVNISRDDLMTTGFRPADFTGPITINVTRLAGPDYEADKVCPPAGWTPEQAGAEADGTTSSVPETTSTTPETTTSHWTTPSPDSTTTSGATTTSSTAAKWAPGLESSVWFTLTPVVASEKQATAMEEKESTSHHLHAVAGAVAAGLACCSCACLAGCLYMVFGRGKQYDGYGSSSECEFDHGYGGPLGGRPPVEMQAMQGYGPGYQFGGQDYGPGYQLGGHGGPLTNYAQGAAPGGYVPGMPPGGGGYVPGQYVPGRPY